MKQDAKVTARDIAQACGISQATVSYVLNDKQGARVGEDTRRKILETAEKLNYIPNSAARSMRTRRSMSIGIISGRNMVSMGSVLQGIKKYLDGVGYTITLLNGEENTFGEDQRPFHREILQYYVSNRMDGLLFLFYELSDATQQLLSEKQIPYLALDENGISGEGLSGGHAFEEVLMRCAAYCRERALFHIRFFTLQRGEQLHSFKYNMFQDAVSACYPEADMKRVIFQAQGLSDEEIRSKLDDFLEAEEFDLAVTPNQRIGLLMQACILKRGLHYPQSIKHICLASSHVCDLVYPTVTSVDVPLWEMGEYAAGQIVRMIDGMPVVAKEFACSLNMGMSSD